MWLFYSYIILKIIFGILIILYTQILKLNFFSQFQTSHLTLSKMITQLNKLT